MSGDPARVAIRVGVYVVLSLIALNLFAWALLITDDPVIQATGAVLFSAALTNWLLLRIFEAKPLTVVGLWLTSASSRNLALGLLGGVVAAGGVLSIGLASGAAHLNAYTGERGSLVFLLVLLAGGAMGEELLFRGYAFQLLLRPLGIWAAILPDSVLFALAHRDNPSASVLGLINTGAFGVLFCYAYLRSRDLWLPIGLHLGWNFTLPLFGVNLSGLRMKVTGYEMSWSAGALWSGGEYGPEASILTSAVVLALFLFIWKAPIRRQTSPLADPPAEKAVCEPSPLSPS